MSRPIENLEFFQENELAKNVRDELESISLESGRSLQEVWESHKNLQRAAELVEKDNQKIPERVGEPRRPSEPSVIDFKKMSMGEQKEYLNKKGISKKNFGEIADILDDKVFSKRKKGRTNWENQGDLMRKQKRKNYRLEEEQNVEKQLYPWRHEKKPWE